LESFEVSRLEEVSRLRRFKSWKGIGRFTNWKIEKGFKVTKVQKLEGFK